MFIRPVAPVGLSAQCVDRDHPPLVRLSTDCLTANTARWDALAACRDADGPSYDPFLVPAAWRALQDQLEDDIADAMYRCPEGRAARVCGKLMDVLEIVETMIFDPRQLDATTAIRQTWERAVAQAIHTFAQPLEPAGDRMHAARRTARQALDAIKTRRSWPCGRTVVLGASIRPSLPAAIAVCMTRSNQRNAPPTWPQLAAGVGPLTQ